MKSIQNDLLVQSNVSQALTACFTYDIYSFISGFFCPHALIALLFYDGACVCQGRKLCDVVSSGPIVLVKRLKYEDLIPVSVSALINCLH